MTDTISTKKLKRVMYLCLRWRLQLPANLPIPPKEKMTEFSKGVKTAYQDLLRAINEIESSDNQRNLYNKSYVDDNSVEEYSWENESKIGGIEY